MNGSDGMVRVYQADKRVIPVYRKLFDETVEFTLRNHPEYHGLLNLIGDPAVMLGGDRPVVTKLNGRLLKKYGSVEDIVNNREKLFDLFKEMQERYRDGGLAFGSDNRLIGTEVFVNYVDGREVEKPMRDLIKSWGIEWDDQTYTRHMAGASASLRGVPAIVGSETRRTVTGFLDGELESYADRFAVEKKEVA